VFCWERKSWTSWLLTCFSKKGWAAEKSSKKGVNRKENSFLSSQTRWSWQNKRACTSFWTCSSSPGHWSHMREPSSNHAAASTFKVCARKLNLLTLRITCLDRSRWRYRGTIVGIRSFLEKGVANQEWEVASLLLCVLGSTNSASLQTPLILCFKSAVNSCVGITRPVWTARTYNSRPRSPLKALSNWAVQQALERGCYLRSAWTTLRKVSLLVLSILWTAWQLTETSKIATVHVHILGVKPS